MSYQYEPAAYHQVALYVGDAGRYATYPITGSGELPATITRGDGAVLTLRMIHTVPIVADAELRALAALGARS